MFSVIIYYIYIYIYIYSCIRVYTTPNDGSQLQPKHAACVTEHTYLRFVKHWRRVSC